MENAAPGSKKGMEQFFALADETRRALAYLEEAGAAPDSKKLRKEYPNFLKSASYSLHEVLFSLHLPKKAIAILEAYWCYLGMDAPRLNFQHYLSMVSDLVDHGAYIPEGTSNAITTALLDAFLSQGGQALFNTTALHFLAR
jgi:phytoene dehydrogenase-like protein